MKKVNAVIYGKQYKDYYYTVKRLHNTTQGHPNYEIAIFSPINKRFDILGEVFHVVTYEDIYKFTENYIDKKGGEE